MARPSPEEREQQAVEAAQQAARQIRRFFETGNEKAKVDSGLVPLIYELAPTTKIIGKDEVEYSKKWEKNNSAFKVAVKAFRGQALKAGYAVPRETNNPVRYQSGGTDHSASDSSSPALVGKPEDAEMPDVAEHLPSPPASTNAASSRDSASPAPTQDSSPPAHLPSNKDSAPQDPPAPKSPVRPSTEKQPQEQSLPKDIWSRFEAAVSNVHSPGWRAIQQECLLYGCDFADVKFRCEFRLKHKAQKDNADGLLTFASNWIRICPEALDLLDRDCGGDSIMKSHIAAYRQQNPRIVSMREERDSNPRSRLFSEAPEQDRQERGFSNRFEEAEDGYDKITFDKDPDDPDNPERRNVEGTICFAIAGYLDVSLPSLNHEHADLERHILVKQSEFSDKAKTFLGTKDGAAKYLRHGADEALLKGKDRDDFVVVSYSSEKCTKPTELWPRTYVAAYPKGDDKSSLNVWARTAWHSFGKSTIDGEINDEREKRGQAPVVIMKKSKRS